MYSGIGGKKFPELDWVLREKRKTLIFCRTINLGWRLFEYLCGQPSDVVDVEKHIRLYNSLNWPEFNNQTRKWMEEDPACLIAIGTDTMSVGVDISTVEDILILAEPEDADDFVQKAGRPGRNREVVSDAHAILYLPQGSEGRAKRIIEAEETNNSNLLRKGDTMDISLARLVIAACKMDELDKQYDNPVQEDPCTCRGCLAHPRMQRRDPCNCSGCVPEKIRAPAFSKKSGKNTKSKIPQGQRLTRPMRKLGTKHLLAFRKMLFDRGDETLTGMLPDVVFFPDTDIKATLDCFALLNSEEALTTLLQHNSYINNHFKHLFTVVEEL